MASSAPRPAARATATPFRVEPMFGSIVCTPQSVKVGESMCIEIRSPAGQAYDNQEPTPISINGVLGSKQWVTWKTPGEHQIIAAAHHRNAKPEMITASVTVAPAADGVSPPFLHVRWNPERPTSAVFQAYRFAVPDQVVAGTPVRPVVVDALPVVRQVVRQQSPLARLSRTRVARAGVMPRAAVVNAGTAALPYTWQFHTAPAFGSMRGSVPFDFASQMDPDRAYSVFHLSVTINDPVAGPSVIRRSVSVGNAYFLMKRRGVLQPVVEAATPSVSFDQGSWKASLTVRNPEASAMTLTSRTIELIYENASHDRERRAAEPVSISLKAKQATTIDIVLPKSALPLDAVAFIAHFTGTGPKKLPVRVEAAFDIPQHRTMRCAPAPTPTPTRPPGITTPIIPTPGTSPISPPDIKPPNVSPPDIAPPDIKPASGAVRTPAVSALTPNARAVAATVASVASVAAAVPIAVRPAAPTPPPPPPPQFAEGTTCDPWNLPDVIPEGMFCLPTAATKPVTMPARFMNANKGDVVITPNNGGLISNTLSSVSPPQHYSHSGMMTRNRDQITHSTAAEDRLTNDKFVSASGFREDVLKYLWPGVITQDIKHAVDGEDFVDPENGDVYSVSGFGTIEASQDLQDGTGASNAWAMVIKPDPLLETPDVRTTLHGIADFAAAQAGKSHYRFFCYTNPALGLTEKAPPSAKWAAGTFPTVCSSLVWMSIKSSGVTIEGALEPADIDAGAQIAVNTPDGLYVYQADERLIAAKVLYGRIFSMAKQKIGGFWHMFIDFPEDISNQVLNAFAGDWSDADAGESDKWKQTTDANAVSPQNLLTYDTPLYGYSEPLIYRSERVEDIPAYVWTHVAQTGTVTGVVRNQGKALTGANVQITSANATISASGGKFTLTKVPKGNVIIHAQKVINGILYSVDKAIAVNGDATTNVTLDLAPPSHVYRRIIIDGDLKVIDYEFMAAAYPKNHSVFNAIIDLDPTTSTHATRQFDCVADDDTLGRLILTVDLQPDDSVMVKAMIRSYDSGTDDTDDYDEGELAPFKVNAGGAGSWWIYVDGENYAHADFNIQNITNQS